MKVARLSALRMCYQHWSQLYEVYRGPGGGFVVVVAGTVAAPFVRCDYKRNSLIGQYTHSCVIHIRLTFSSVFSDFMVHGHR
jgi:hypothetical protein